MRRLFLKSAFCLLVAAAAASASTIYCADQTNDAHGVGGSTLDKYIALGATGCEIGDLVFSNFAYAYTMGTDAFYVSGLKGTGTQQNANVVAVAVNPGNNEFQFGANWIVNHYQTANLTISFRVASVSPGQITTVESVFTSTKGGTQNGGPTATQTATCTGGTCAPTTFTNQNKAIPATLGPLQIVDTVSMNAKGSTMSSSNNFHLSIIDDQFADPAPPSLPEPFTFALTGAGIGALVFFRRRKLI